jgi:uncharacterized surface protein with fasciclin (FAS1) repeats
MRNLLFFFAILSIFSPSTSIAQCEADTSIALIGTDFETYGEEINNSFIIPLGYSVAFLNFQGNHNLDGVTNNATGEPFNNPVDIFLEETVGTQAGICMGVVVFDTPGTYNFTCSLTGVQAGMNLTIIVDPFDLSDLFIDLYSNQDVPVFNSFFAFNYYTDLLTSEGPWTVFAPNTEAVNDILEYMNLSQSDCLAIPDFPEILSYHIAEGIWLEEDLFDGQQLTSAQGQFLTITDDEEGLFVENAKIISTNYTAYNGIIHVIDKCLAPEELPAAHVMQLIVESEDHQILEQAIIAASLDDELSFQVLIDDSYDSPGPWTVFAPTDSAFEIYAQEMGWTIDEMLESQFIYEIVNYHVIQSQLNSSQMYSGNVAVNLEGETIEFEFDNSDSSIFVMGDQNTVEIINRDLYAYNGIVHSVDAVLETFIPTLEGSCGVWRLLMQSNNPEEGWNGSSLYISVNGDIIEETTIYSGSTQAYEFGVDEGDIIDLYYNPQASSSGQSYKLFDNNNQLVVQSTNSGDYGIGSFTGIKACQPLGKLNCGKITVKSYSEFGAGWLNGSIEVYKNGEFERSITMPIGYKQTTIINSNFDDIFDFIYEIGGFSNETGYEVYGVSGQLLVDETIANTTPESYSDLLICESQTGTFNCIDYACVDPLDGSGDYSSIEECQETCQNPSSIVENDKNVKIYPNPSSTIFNINFYSENENIEISVSSILGEEIYFEKVNASGQYNGQIDLTNYASGLYNLAIKSEVTRNYKLIVQ